MKDSVSKLHWTSRAILYLEEELNTYADKISALFSFFKVYGLD
jgi:hypothetical protein